MRYSELLDKLKVVKNDFIRVRGREPETVQELEEFISLKILKPRTKGLKSLRGLDL